MMKVESRELSLNKYNKYKNMFPKLHDVHIITKMLDWKIMVPTDPGDVFSILYYAPKIKKQLCEGWEITGYNLCIYGDANNHLRLIEVPVDWLLYKERDIASSYKHGIKGTMQILHNVIVEWEDIYNNA